MERLNAAERMKIGWEAEAEGVARRRTGAKCPGYTKPRAIPNRGSCERFGVVGDGSPSGSMPPDRGSV